MHHKFCHLTNTSINVTNTECNATDFTKRAKEVIEAVTKERPKANIWSEIKKVSFFTMLAIGDLLLIQFQLTIRIDLSLKKRSTSPEELELETFSKYFHLVGIDILLSSSLKPIVLN